MFIDNSMKVGNDFYFAGLGPGVTGGTPINQIIAPSANTNGIIIRTLIISSHFQSPNTGASSFLYADTSAPTVVADFSKRCVFYVLSRSGGTASAQLIANAIPYPLAIPAGLGIWLTTQPIGSGDTSACSFAMTWDHVTVGS